MRLSNIYILFFKDHGYIKIGKADDVYSRLSVLVSSWGMIDDEKSFYIKVPHNEVFQLERTLHYICKDFKAFEACRDFTGHTEMFLCGCYDTIIDFLCYIGTLHNRDYSHNKIESIENDIKPPEKQKPYIETIGQDKYLEIVKTVYEKNSGNINNLIRLIYHKNCNISVSGMHGINSIFTLYIDNPNIISDSFDFTCFDKPKQFDIFSERYFEYQTINIKTKREKMLYDRLRLWSKVRYDSNKNKLTIELEGWRVYELDYFMDEAFQNIRNIKITANAPTPIPEAPQIAPVFTSRRFQ